MSTLALITVTPNKLLNMPRRMGLPLFTTTPQAVLEGIYLKRKLKLPLIWHVHEIIVKPKAISDFINFLMGRYADTIVTVSNAVANHVKQSRFVKDDQVQVIYNGVDNAVYQVMDAGSVRDQFGIAQGCLGYWNGWSSKCLERARRLPRSCDTNLTGPSKSSSLLAGSAFEGKSGAWMSWKRLYQTHR